VYSTVDSGLTIT